MSQNFRNIIAWQKADDLVVAVYKVTQKYFPKEEMFALTRQVQRAAVSVAANIAEGSVKRTMVEFRSYLDHSIGSLSEVEYYIHLSQRLGYIDAQTAKSLFDLEAEAAKTLNGFIDAIDRQIAQGRKLNKLPSPSR
jgi:four helix bundle protein